MAGGARRQMATFAKEVKTKAPTQTLIRSQTRTPAGKRSFPPAMVLIVRPSGDPRFQFPSPLYRFGRYLLRADPLRDGMS